ncbi:MAG TPA: SRPBCC domain-containing protein [Rhizomicrobium sp.]|jgi:uncharacterized protein YndB with AHSA1/START domain|nr:SRPBCC domain-containing protein [Rhizomicrobium sp.]
MQRTTIALAAICAALSSAAAAPVPSWQDFKDVTNTSFTEPDGDRSLQLSIDVPASAHDVFAAFSTSEGFSSWAVPVANVDFRVGGMMEASYDSKAKLGDPNNIKNAIVSYIPDRLLIIRNVQAPAGFVDSSLFQKTVTMIEFAPLDAKTTHVTITNAGYGAGAGFADVYSHFEWGDAYTLHELRKRFTRGPVDWAAEEAKDKARAATKIVSGKE